MVLPTTPKGEDRVGLGAKAKKEEGFAMHKAGAHTESDEAKLGKSPSQKKALKPHIR
jgi:hypothetical protein